MDQSLDDLARVLRDITGRPLTDPGLDVFDLGLTSVALMELIARLRDDGYVVTMENLLDAHNMTEVARSMAGSRT